MKPNSKPTLKPRKPDADTRRIHTWKGRVFSDEHGLFNSPYEFQFFVDQEVAMDPFFERPDFVWTAKRLPPVRIDFMDVQYLIESCPSTPTQKSVQDLRTAVKAFNTANATVRYVPDYSAIVPMEWTVTTPAKRVSPPADDSDI